MRRVVFRLAIATAAVVFILQPRRANASDTSNASANGSQIYKANCAVCHGDDGAGSPVGKSLQAPDLRSSKVQSQSDAAIERFISEGNGAMPSFKDRLDHQQIQDEVLYIRQLGKHH